MLAGGARKGTRGDAEKKEKESHPAVSRQAERERHASM